MSQPQAKFSVGEEITLLSVCDPTKNGEYIVESSEFHNQVVCISGKLVTNTWCYTLVGLPSSDAWLEQSLRKKYKPSGQSYTELLESLKDNKPHKEEVNPAKEFLSTARSRM